MGDSPTRYGNQIDYVDGHEEPFFTGVFRFSSTATGHHSTLAAAGYGLAYVEERGIQTGDMLEGQRASRSELLALFPSFY